MVISTEKINIIAHRGFWKKKSEQNSIEAFSRAFDNSFGVEVDLRDVKGEIIISHDMPQGEEIPFEELLQVLSGRDLTLALNIKADGMSAKIKELLDKYHHSNYFTFDMSVPEMLHQMKLNLNVFTGKSDIVTEPILLDQARGVWLDSFCSDWFDAIDIREILSINKQVCIVSPELHGREYRGVWEKYKNVENIAICTDYPMEAWEYFYA